MVWYKPKDLGYHLDLPGYLSLVKLDLECSKHSSKYSSNQGLLYQDPCTMGMTLQPNVRFFIQIQDY